MLCITYDTYIHTYILYWLVPTGLFRVNFTLQCNDMLCYITYDMLCYITYYMLCYLTLYMLCYITYVMLHNISYVL